MPSLKTTLGTGPSRQKIISAAEAVLDQEVGDKSGLTGVAIKGAYQIVTRIKPGFVREVIDILLDDFLDGVEPIYQEAGAKGVSFREHLIRNSGRMADSLLAVTDGRAAKSQHAAIRKTYDKLRPTAKKHVEASAPRLGAMLERLLAGAVP